MSIGRLIVEFEARTGKFETDTGRAAKIMEKRAREIDAQVSKIATAAAAAFTAAAGAVAVLVKNSIDAQDELSKMSQKVGIATDELSKLAYAANLADVDLETLSTSLAKLAKIAVDPTTEAAAAFEALGVSIKGADGQVKNTGDLLGDLADAFSSFADGPEKTAAAIAIFGRAGANLIPLLNSGREAIRDAGDELERFGGVVTPEAGRQAEAFNDNLTRLKTIAGGVANTLAAELLDSLVGTSDELVDAAAQAEIATNIVEGLEVAFKSAAVAATLFAGAIAGPAIAAFAARLYGIAAAALAARSAALQMGIATGSFSAKAVAATAATRAWGVSLALLGGPAGIAASAAIGLGVYILGLESAEEKTKTLANRVKELRGEFGAMTSEADSAELKATQKRIEDIDKAISSLQSKLISASTTNAGGQGFFDKLSNERASENLKNLARERAELLQVEAALQDRLSGVTPASSFSAAEPEAPTLAFAGAEQTEKKTASIKAQKNAIDEWATSLESARAISDEVARMEDERNRIMEEGKRLTESLRSPLEEYEAGVTRLNELLAAGAINQETYNRAVFGLQDAFNQATTGFEKIGQSAGDTGVTLTAFADQAARNMQDAFADFLFNPFEDGLRGMLRSFAQALQRMAAEALAANIFGALTGGGGGLLGSIISALPGLGGGAPISPMPRALGGPVSPESLYMVGERGPELFVPKTAGTIVPNEAMGKSQQSIRIVNAFDTSVISDYMSSAAGEQTFTNLLSRNGARIRAITAGAE